MMAAALKKQFESVLGDSLEWQARPAPEMLPSGIREVDDATGGLPRGCLTEIVGPASSGRTSLLLSILAQATAREEICGRLLPAAPACCFRFWRKPPRARKFARWWMPRMPLT